LIGALGTVDATSTLPIREGANLIVGAVAMATLFTLQQRRMISGKQPNLLLALNNAKRYLGASIGAATGLLWPADATLLQQKKYKILILLSERRLPKP
jgi:hypothetical protein